MRSNVVEFILPFRPTELIIIGHSSWNALCLKQPYQLNHDFHSTQGNGIWLRQVAMLGELQNEGSDRQIRTCEFGIDQFPKPICVHPIRIEMIDTICACLTNFELCTIVRGAIEQRFGYDEIVEEEVSLPHELKVMFYVEMCEGFARGNGFDSLLCMYCDHPFLEQAYREIGQDDLADLMAEALASFPASDRYEGHHLPFVDWPSYEKYATENPEVRVVIKALNERFFDVSLQEVLENLSRYIRIQRGKLNPILNDLEGHHEFELVRARI